MSSIAIPLLISPFVILCAIWFTYETLAQVNIARLDRQRITQRGSRVYPEPVTLTVIRKGH